MLVGAMIDPYDSLLDQAGIEIALGFSRKLFDVFDSNWSMSQSQSSPSSPEEKLFFTYFYVLRKNIPFLEHPGFWQTLKALHIIQTISILQRKDASNKFGLSLSLDELQRISTIKGGLNSILYLSLIDDSYREVITELPENSQLSQMSLGTLKENFLSEQRLYQDRSKLTAAFYKEGALIQLIDDYGDAVDDRNEGVLTAMNTNLQQLTFLKNFRSYLKKLEDDLYSSDINSGVAKKIISCVELFLFWKIAKRFKQLV